MPKEIPGFYYDEEKNRYFPLKGPLPGSSRKRKPPASVEKLNLQSDKAKKAHNSLRKCGHKLLHFRELSGSRISSIEGRFNFQAECQKKLASQPSMWKYPRVFFSCSLEQIRLQVDMPAGPTVAEFLVTGSTNGDLCLFDLGKVAPEIHDGNTLMPACAWPCNIDQLRAIPPNLWRSSRALLNMPSDVSCVKAFCSEDGAFPKHLLVTTLGSGLSAGAVYICDLRIPTDPDLHMRPHEIYSIDDTIWSADCNHDGRRAVIGRNQGASVLDIETGTPSWIYKCKSDALSTTFDDSGKVILCGLRSGQIVTLDTRQKPRHAGRQRIPHAYNAPGAKLLYSSCETCMPSSISSLVPLRYHDQYLLASSMDGSIKLYDCRQMQRGCIQSYNGNKNSHTRIQLGVDPSENFFMSGGEDCKIRMWCIKSGEMLFESPSMNTVPLAVCWPRTGGQESKDYWSNHRWGAWFGSAEGIFYMNWP